MVRVPNILATKQDIYNILDMINSGALDAEDKAKYLRILKAMINTATHKYVIVEKVDTQVQIYHVGDEINVGDVVNGTYTVTAKDVIMQTELAPGETVLRPEYTLLTLDTALSDTFNTIDLYDYDHSRLASAKVTLEEVNIIINTLENGEV